MMDEMPLHVPAHWLVETILPLANLHLFLPRPEPMDLNSVLEQLGMSGKAEKMKFNLELNKLLLNMEYRFPIHFYLHHLKTA